MKFLKVMSFILVLVMLLGSCISCVSEEESAAVNYVTPQLKIGDDNLWYVSYDSGSTWVSLGVSAIGEKGEKGDKGSNGTKGDEGDSGITPLIKIDKNNYWCVSYDNGATWTSLGVKATADGNSSVNPPIDDGEGNGSVVPSDEIDFGGESLTILHRNSMALQREWYKDVAEDDLDEIIAIRNAAVEDALNLNIRYQPMASSSYWDCLNEFTAAIKEDVDYDFHYYDIVANYAYTGADLAVRDYLANLADTDIFPYFDFTLPCWNQSIVESTYVNGMLYYITGDMNLSTFDKTMVVFLNKSMYNKKKTANDPDDLQDLALEGYDIERGVGVAGGFTYDVLYRWASIFEESNGSYGNQHDDFHAISAAYSSIPLDSLPYAWNLDYVVTNNDGSHSYNVVGNSKIEQAIVKAQNLFNSSLPSAVGVSNHDNTGNCSLGGYSEPISHFAADKSIFAIHVLYSNETDNLMLREMNSEFGLLPMPKYDSNQLDYGTTAHDSYTLMTVIDHSMSSVPTKGEEVSAYLQCSTEVSYATVRAYYINRIVKPKYFGTDDSNGAVSKSIQIFNIIADNVEFDFLSVYAPQLNGILSSCWRKVVTGEHIYGAITAKDAYESEQATYDAMLEEVDGWLGLR